MLSAGSAMGAAAGGGGTGGRVSPVQSSGGMSLQKFTDLFKKLTKALDFLGFWKQSDQNPRRNQNLRVGGFDGPESVPQSKLRGGAAGFWPSLKTKTIPLMP